MEPVFCVGFGSALNIETLVAAAERRETPIEVLYPCASFAQMASKFDVGIVL